MALISAGGIALPDPVSMSIDGEIIWSEDTGRTLSGSMVGDVIAEKKKLSVKWEFLFEGDVALIKSKLTSGFFPVTFRDIGGTTTITSYRSTLSVDPIGERGGGYLYRSVSVDLIQR